MRKLKIPLHRGGAGVHEGLVDLGHGEVPVDRHLDVEALDDERKSGLAAVSRRTRADRPDAERRRLGLGVGRREAAGPVVPRDGWRLRDAAGGERQELAGDAAVSTACAHRPAKDVHAHLPVGRGIDACSRVGELDPPARRVDLHRRPVLGVDEGLALVEGHGGVVLREPRRAGDEPDGPAIATDPGERPGRQRDGLAFRQALPGIWSASRLPRRRDRDRSLDRTHLGERVPVRDHDGRRVVPATLRRRDAQRQRDQRRSLASGDLGHAGADWSLLLHGSLRNGRGAPQKAVSAGVVARKK